MKAAANTVNPQPVYCPYCRTPRCIFVNTFHAVAHDDADNECDLDEYQCVECDYRSFWL